MKHVETEDATMSYAFIITDPIERKFSCALENEPSSTRAELMAIIYVLLICPKNCKVSLFTDSKNVIDRYNNIKDLELTHVKKCSYTDIHLWCLMMRIIGFLQLKVIMTKVKAHSGDKIND